MSFEPREGWSVTIVAPHPLPDSSGWSPDKQKDGLITLNDEGHGEKKNTNMGELDVRERAVFVVDGNTFHRVQCGVLAVYYLAKYGVLGIEVCLFSICDEELRLVGVRP